LKAQILAVLFASFLASPVMAQQTVNVSFPLGGVIGTVGSNTGQANSIVNTANLGITSITFSQTNNGTDGRFGGTQGNDYCGTLTLSGVTNMSFPACVNWRITTGNTANYIGFVPEATANIAPVGAPITLPYFGTFAAFNSGYNVVISSALNNAAPESNFAFRTNNTTAQVYADGENRNGNAAASSALAALNTFVGFADTTSPIITGPDGTSTTTGLSSNISLNAGGTAVYAFSANEPVTWSISGTDAGDFVINPTTGVLTFVAPTNFLAPVDSDGNNVYVVTIRALDGAGNATTQTLTVTILQVSDATAPVVTAGQTLSYAENQTAGSVIGTVLATDAVGVTGFRFTNGGNTTSSDGYYTIAANGQVTITAAGVAAGVANNDFETGANSFTYGIQATDAAGNWSPSVNVAFVVTDLDDTAPVVTGGQTLSYAENRTAGSVIGTVLATDSVGVTGFRFTNGGNTTSSDGYYTIAANGQVTITALGVAAGVANNDFETGANSFTYGIQATDAAGNWSPSVNVAFAVTDLDDTAPVLGPPSGLNVADDGAIELQAGVATVGTLAANESIQNWDIVEAGPDHDRFQLLNGVLSFKEAPAFDPAPGADNTYVVTVEGIDLAGNRSTLTLTIRIVDSAAMALARDRSDIEQVIVDAEIAKLRGQQNSLRAMTSSARDRLAGAGGCGSAEEEGATSTADEQESCRDFEENNLNVDANSDLVTLSASNHSVRTFNGIRRIVNLNLGVSDEENIRTLSFSGYAALENFRAENALYGLFVGMNVSQNDVSRGMGGAVDSYGLSVGAYAVHEFAKGLFSEAYLSLGRSQNQLDLSDSYLDVAADYGTTEANLGWIVSGVYERGNFDFWPEMGIQVSRSRSSSIEVDGSIPGDTTSTVWNGLTATLSRANLSTDIRYYIAGRAPDAWILNVKPGVVCERVDAIVTRSGCGMSGLIGLNQSSLDGSRRFSAQIGAEEIEEITRSSASVMYELRF
jgi:hypothetical protein